MMMMMREVEMNSSSFNEVYFMRLLSAHFWKTNPKLRLKPEEGHHNMTDNLHTRTHTSLDCGRSQSA